MDKNYFAVYLIPPRPDFSQTMTAEERDFMQQHAVYWTNKMNEGKVAAFGPVLHPDGTYGLGIVVCENEKELTEFIAHDPAAMINRYEFFPMKAVVPNTAVN